MNHEIQRIISGESQIRYGANIHAAIGYLEGSEKASTPDKTNKCFKLEETKRLIQYADNQNLWIKNIDLNNFFLYEDKCIFFFFTIVYPVFGMWV
jgi:hypothetical protein